MLNTAVYWLAAAAFLFGGAAALVRPEAILRIRAKIRPHETAEGLTGARRRSKFGAREVRICGVALLMIGAGLIVILV